MEHQYLQAGEIVNTHGIRGEVKILPWADEPEFLLEFDRFRLDGRDYAVESARVHKGCVLCKLAGVDDVNAAQLLRGKIVEIDRSGIELEDGAHFIADLIGLRALDDDDREIGTVREILTLPGNDVYVVRGQREYMIPGVSEFLREVNVEGGYIRFHLLEGMAADAN